MKKEEIAQIAIAQAIFNGAILDKDGYCGCHICGSRNLEHDGYALDYGYLKCLDCNFWINGTDPYEMISRWNLFNRNSFQLKIIFEEV